MFTSRKVIDRSEVLPLGMIVAPCLSVSGGHADPVAQRSSPVPFADLPQQKPGRRDAEREVCRLLRGEERG